MDVSSTRALFLRSTKEKNDHLVDSSIDGKILSQSSVGRVVRQWNNSVAAG